MKVEKDVVTCFLCNHIYGIDDVFQDVSSIYHGKELAIKVVDFKELHFIVVLIVSIVFRKAMVIGTIKRVVVENFFMNFIIKAKNCIDLEEDFIILVLDRLIVATTKLIVAINQPIEVNNS